MKRQIDSTYKHTHTHSLTHSLSHTQNTHTHTQRRSEETDRQTYKHAYTHICNIPYTHICARAHTHTHTHSGDYDDLKRQIDKAKGKGSMDEIESLGEKLDKMKLEGKEVRMCVSFIYA